MSFFSEGQTVEGTAEGWQKLLDNWRTTSPDEKQRALRTATVYQELEQLAKTNVKYVSSRELKGLLLIAYCREILGCTFGEILRSDWKWDGGSGVWRGHITTPELSGSVEVSGELADRIFEFDQIEDLEQLRKELLTGLGRTEFIVDR